MNKPTTVADSASKRNTDSSTSKVVKKLTKVVSEQHIWIFLIL